MAVDFGKLNKAGLGATTFGARKTTGTSAQATKNLQNSTAATRSTLFSFKRSPRTNWVPGQHVTKGQSQYNYQGMRASLNGAAGVRRSYAPSFAGPVGNFGMPNVQVNNDMAKGMMTAQALMMGMGVLNQLGVLGGNDGVKSSTLGDKLGDALGNLGGTGNVSTFAGKLANADSFGDLNKLESSVEAKKSSLGADYQALDPKTEMETIMSGVSEGFELAGVNLDTNGLTLSNLDSSNLEKCIEDIEGDIDKFGNFLTSDIPNAKTQITTKSGQVKGEISALEGQISQLKANNKDGQNSAKIAELEQQLAERRKDLEALQKAEQGLQELSNSCEATKSDLEAKKAEVKDMKKFEDNVKDKKYNLAKSQDKDLKQALDKLKKLDVEIKKASVDKNPDDYNKKDERREDKLNKLNAERAEVFGSMSKLIGSLSAAGGAGTEFKNSKGSTYQIANLDAARAYKPEEVST